MYCFPTLQRFQFRFQARDDLVLPVFKGSPWRGLFGHVFKDITCSLKRSSCPSCLLKTNCYYVSIFDTPSVGLRECFIEGPNARPRPFILVPPLDSRRLIPSGETFTTEITLTGPALEVIPHVVLTFLEMGNRGIGSSRAKFNLQEGFYWAEGGWTGCYSAGDAQITLPKKMTPTPLPAANGYSCQKVVMNTVTPLRLKYRGKPVDTPTFPIIIRALLRRLDDYSRLYGMGPLPEEIPKLIRMSEDISLVSSDIQFTDIQRYSNRQKREMKMGGIQGQLVFAGHLEPFFPWLTLGEMLHIGKSSTFGFGKYTLEWMNEKP